MKGILVIIMMSLSLFSAKAQNDTLNHKGTGQANQKDPITCAYVDVNTIACFTEKVDVNSDGRVDPQEWQNASPSEKGIVELGNVRQKNEAFELGRQGEFEELYNFNEGDLYEDHTYEGDYDRYDHDPIDPEEDGPF